MQTVRSPFSTIFLVRYTEKENHWVCLVFDINYLLVAFSGLTHFKDLISAGDEIIPGLVHRSNISSTTLDVNRFPCAS